MSVSRKRALLLFAAVYGAALERHGFLEQFAVQQLTMRVDILDADPQDVARSFVKRVLSK